MILNVSGRTDIVKAFYTSWFMNRYHEGFLMLEIHFIKNK